MGTSDLDRAWAEQSQWSQVADQLKGDLERKRTLRLSLAIVGATLAAAAITVGLDSRSSKLLAFASAASIAVAGVVRLSMSERAIQDWTRARSVSEAIKSEVYLYLAGVERADFADHLAAIETDGHDLLRYKLDVRPRIRPLPEIHDIDSYLQLRVEGQIQTYYRPRAQALARKIALVRRIEVALGLVGAVLAAAAATWGKNDIAVWVPVVTTVGATVTAHAGAARYEYLLTEYLRTAHELERLRDRRGSASKLTDHELIRKAEDVISIQNEGWMAKLANDDS